MTEIVKIEKVEKTTDIDTLTAFIYVGGNDLWTDSRKVAVAFERLHKNVLQKIDELERQSPPEWFGLNFKPAEFIDKNGSVRRCVEMTRDGFVMLVMGFTGEKAIAIKLGYIDAFNQMERQINYVKKTLSERLACAKISEQLDFAQASFHAKALCSRKATKRRNQAEIAEIQQQIQPDLFGFLD